MIQPSRKFYAIIAKDSDDVLAFTLMNGLDPEDFIHIQSPVQLKKLTNTTVIFMQNWYKNYTSGSTLFKERMIEAAFWCGKRPGNNVKMGIHIDDCLERPKIRGMEPTSIIYDEAIPNAYIEARKKWIESMTPEEYQAQYQQVWIPLPENTMMDEQMQVINDAKDKIAASLGLSAKDIGIHAIEQDNK